jgi:hypothetical protein
MFAQHIFQPTSTVQQPRPLQPSWPDRLRHLIQAIQQAKAESDAWVAEGRRITGWREPVGFQRRLTRLWRSRKIH